MGAWPGRVTAWVNVADADDIVALRKHLAPLFPASHGGTVGIEDHLVDNGEEPHAVDPLPQLPSRRAKRWALCYELTLQGLETRCCLRLGTKTYRHGAGFRPTAGEPWICPGRLALVVEAFTGSWVRSRSGGAHYLLDPSLQRLKEAVRATAGVSAGRSPLLHRAWPEARREPLLSAHRRRNGRVGLMNSAGGQAVSHLALRKDEHGGLCPPR